MRPAGRKSSSWLKELSKMPRKGRLMISVDLSRIRVKISAVRIVVLCQCIKSLSAASMEIHCVFGVCLSFYSDPSSDLYACSFLVERCGEWRKVSFPIPVVTCQQHAAYLNQ